MTEPGPEDPKFLARVWRFAETSDAGEPLEPAEWFALADYLAGAFKGMLSSYYALARGLDREQAEREAQQLIGEQRAMHESLATPPLPRPG